MDAEQAEQAEQVLQVAYEATWRYVWSRSHLRWDFGTLLGDATEGALDAARRYDPARGASLRTWCHRRATGAIRDGLWQRSVATRYAAAHASVQARPLLVLAEIPEQRSEADPYRTVEDRDEVLRLIRDAALTSQQMEIIVECVMFGTCTQSEMARRYGVTEGRIAHVRREVLDRMRGSVAPSQIRITTAQRAAVIADPRTQVEIAADYGISQRQVSRLRARARAQKD